MDTSLTKFVKEFKKRYPNYTEPTDIRLAKPFEMPQCCIIPIKMIKLVSRIDESQEILKALIDKGLTPDSKLINVFAGVGGDSIAMLGYLKQLTAIELDVFNIECFRHNVQCCGLSKGLNIIQGDYLMAYPLQRFDFAFFDHPWEMDFDLELVLDTLENDSKRRVKKILAFKLPPDFKIPILYVNGKRCKVDKVAVRSSKGRCVFNVLFVYVPSASF